METAIVHQEVESAVDMLQVGEIILDEATPTMTSRALTQPISIAAG